MSRPAVLVTGAYGFVGAAYCAHLEANGVAWIGAVRARRRDDEREAIFEAGDFAGTDWDALFARHSIRHVVHLAARAHRMQETGGDPAAEYRRENVQVTDRLLRASHRAGAQRFVFASTVKVHGESTPPGFVLRETDPIAPAGDYARSKAAAEERVARFGRELGLPAVILRLPLVYGRGVKANFGDLVAAVRARRILPLGAIANRRSLVGLANVCSAIDCVREHPAAAGQAYLVSDGDDLSTPELVRAIAAAYGVRPRLWRLPPRVLRLLGSVTGRRAAVERLLGSLVVDDARIRRSLGWKPVSSVADELARMARAA